ncbi:TonB-dependent receptor [Billgrantia gudaonensis]|uniref:TonB-dependent receptor n=1 Tax=Billgrantia gudaonensis TaxID=376427 RepID=A0A3S0NHE1_9GAMM|nr:TonB-dependent receptor [Halomonas gudaonensis]
MIDDRVSVYASYTEIFQPQSSQKVNGDFDPRTGQQFEVGWEYMNGHSTGMPRSPDTPTKSWHCRSDNPVFDCRRRGRDKQEI